MNWLLRLFKINLKQILCKCEAIFHFLNIESDSSVIYVMHFLKAFEYKKMVTRTLHTP